MAQDSFPLAQKPFEMVQDATRVVHNIQPEAQAAVSEGASSVRPLVLTGFGINCEEEVAAAYHLAGATATIVHLNQVLHGQVSIHDFDVLNFPGGFSFGDDLGSGVVLANKLRYRQTGPGGRTLLDDIRQFIADGKFVLGICNGFQVLVKLGLLPNQGGNVTPEVTLTHNASGRYEDRWVTLRVNPNACTPFLKDIDTLEVPVRHGEGRLVVPDAATSAAIEAGGLNCLSYIDAAGDGTDVYPFNPNGAALNCAGLTDPTGQVFGLMPHPEAFLSAYNHPDWARRRRQNPSASEEGAGLRIFRNIVAHVAQLRMLHPPGPPLLQRGGSLEASADVGDGKEGIADRVEESAAGYGSGASSLHLTADKRSWHGQLKGFGQQMRKQPTQAEEQLWQELRGRKLEGYKFRRQHAIEHYIVDFICLEAGLIIEADGGIHQEPGQAEYDQGRTHDLQALGYRLLRFSNHEILNQPAAVLATITHELHLKTPKSTPTTTPQSPGSPLSEGEGGRGDEALAEQPA
ncbi:phosphoribosylformylglycinamidine synthase subunit PurQ [Hymenobacter sp.]|uniref:phosphoribosylformylglycinamidine synthase subunit PurQ n=1 Tax=Hymenobacter sp. TaxID=1898978 RepID=UPI00286BBDA7|nr:phosphoribosylformylglycinamidine synthase subunit PurQ [Hymenobacter sp.]